MHVFWLFFFEVLILRESINLSVDVLPKIVTKCERLSASTSGNDVKNNSISQKLNAHKLFMLFNGIHTLSGILDLNNILYAKLMITLRLPKLIKIL